MTSIGPYNENTINHHFDRCITKQPHIKTYNDNSLQSVIHQHFRLFSLILEKSGKINYLDNITMFIPSDKALYHKYNKSVAVNVF